MNVLDRVITWVAPQWGARRARARAMARHFDAASIGRRTDGWTRLATDANAAAVGNALSLLRGQARDLVRNNPWARHALRRLTANIIGWGIRPKATGPGAERITKAWRDWAETTQCDSAGRLTMYGLQALVMRTVARDGEVLIRRRWRLPTDGFSVAMQLQILEPDFLDTGRNGVIGDAGGPVIQGVEFDPIGRRAAYWLFDRHPGSIGAFGVGAGTVSPVSKRVPATEVIHVFDQERAGQVRGPSWFASVDLRLHDFAEFEDATLMKAKIAACLAAFVTDLDNTGASIGIPGRDAPTNLPTDTFEPGMIVPLPPGKQVTVANPPASADHQSYTACSLRGIAAGFGVTYEDLTGDYSQVNYSSGRMGRLAHQQDVHDWRWNMIIPQYCVPVWSWMVQALVVAGDLSASAAAAAPEWHPAPMPMLEPGMESKAYQQRVRNGQMTWPQMVRELGEDPDKMLDEIQQFNAELDRRGIALDCDPRQMTAAGMVQPPQQPGGQAAAAAPATDTGGDTGEIDDAAAA